ncbi:hypothetical protein GVN18_29210 [Pseudomonas sp. ODNR1LW]|nr:hypothetical protein [Pseudomonas sp. ODNR1LW]
MPKPRFELPTNITCRGLTLAQAAAMAGLSEGRFAVARAKGDYPNPTLPGRRIDRVLLEQAMDRLSGIVSAEEEQDPLAAWESKRRARQA